MEKRMTTDLSEAQQQRGPEKAMLEQVEEYQQEVLKERYAHRKSSAFLSSSKHSISPLFPHLLNRGLDSTVATGSDSQPNGT